MKTFHAISSYWVPWHCRGIINAIKTFFEYSSSNNIRKAELTCWYINKLQVRPTRTTTVIYIISRFVSVLYTNAWIFDKIKNSSKSSPQNAGNSISEIPDFEFFSAGHVPDPLSDLSLLHLTSYSAVVVLHRPLRLSLIKKIENIFSVYRIRDRNTSGSLGELKMVDTFTPPIIAPTSIYSFPLAHSTRV